MRRLWLRSGVALRAVSLLPAVSQRAGAGPRRLRSGTRVRICMDSVVAVFGISRQRSRLRRRRRRVAVAVGARARPLRREQGECARGDAALHRCQNKNTMEGRLLACQCVWVSVGFRPPQVRPAHSCSPPRYETRGRREGGFLAPFFHGAPLHSPVLQAAALLLLRGGPVRAATGGTLADRGGRGSRTLCARRSRFRPTPLGDSCGCRPTAD